VDSWTGNDGLEGRCKLMDGWMDGRMNRQTGGQEMQCRPVY
jgi:hypothetical protein